ncbi:MAG TPA: metal ABC transporter ATP-binding protein [Brevefilum fermentans]|jgi:zinc transport system ATP-binding protein|uniref:Zinc uptake system ATP-binding protein ZurA n=1 Tax=Candidatus Brevifilum fermentans TaxID=1986204 RepID=A0A1Y6K8W1_9CHLR|nr:metal ABC transporter ATP-binding protein [Brevefilum fermentans]MDI9565778.1 metal ABC transporter ATP-binding protein [Chloroflexota bacterium]OQB83827.1 MAG: High-affinity zinc uptake system ATP-binding protein ZnuC [Chloroflexi bacterium ADurb.Bin120]SMX55308.1 Zinc uptake system ATP-binding protein ZurA [Brevefilum fermentans]HOM66782.1 metal ABC transporter ATP-binding protein [Brevefilum fermentans]HPX95912.1 metal ABC transporter ATP-binding protein [Brevefilum fermentans]
MNDIFKNSQPLVEIKNLYAGYQYEVVLEDINLTIEQDDFIGLIGPNGGGKTTLLRVLLGLLQPKSGSITVMGETPEKGRRRIGYVPQFAEYDAEFPISVRDVVRMGRLSSQRLFKPYSTEDDRVVDERLDWVGMLEYQDRAIRELSGGQRQRVYIARALTTNPTLLVLDEPTISVDIEARTQIYELLHKINQDGVTIFLVTHDLNVISSYVKTIGCLNRKLHYHGEKQITDEMLQSTYGCPVDLIAHGLPHRVLAEHKGGN